MKILSIFPAHEDALAIGGPIATTKVLHQILSIDNHIDILSSDMGLELSEKRSVEFGRWAKNNGRIRTRYFRYYGYDNFTFMPSLVPFLLFNMRRYNHVLLAGVWNFPVLAACVFARVFHIPYTIIPHGTLYETRVQAKSQIIKSVFLKCGVLNLLKHAKKIVFTTQDELDSVVDYLKLSTKNCVVVPNAIDVHKYEDLPHKNSFKQRYSQLLGNRYLLYYGRITPIKGMDLLLPVFAKLIQHFEDLYLVIAGGDNEGYLAKLDHLFDLYNIRTKVVITGMLYHEQAKEAMVDAEMFVLPSYAENFGMSVVEAMLCNTATIISNHVGIYKDVLRENAGVVVTLDENGRQLFAAIRELLNNEQQRQSYATAGKAFVKRNYSVDVVAKLLRNLFDE